MSGDSFINYGTAPSAVLIPMTLAPPVPLWAVSSIGLQESYHMPPVGVNAGRAMVDTHDDTVTISAMLVGWERYIWKEALETLAESTLGGGLLGGAFGPARYGMVLWTAMTLRSDMFIQSVSFSASSAKRGTLDVSITLKHLPRPGPVAAVLDLVNCASSSLLDGFGVIG
jgi:hypothetical protein